MRRSLASSTFAGILLSISSSLAGECDCKPDVSNAEAIVLKSCSKMWVQNFCTLREVGATNSSGESVEALKQKFHIPALFLDNYGATLRENFSASALQSAVIFTADAKLNIDFIADVLYTIGDYDKSIQAAWGRPELRSFKGKISTSTVKDRCFYSKSFDNTANFYLNFNARDAPCEAWGDR